MNTSPNPTALSKPTGKNKISLGTLSYFRARNKHRVFNLVIEEFEKSGLIQADLGRRLAMDAGQLSRYLNAPGNWTLDMLSDFLFAISGAEAGYSIFYPLEQPPRNLTEPWLQQPTTVESGTVAQKVDLVPAE